MISTITAKLATAGRHVLAIRIVDTGGGGGIGGSDDDQSIHAVGSGSPRVELAGEWMQRAVLSSL